MNRATAHRPQPPRPSAAGPTPRRGPRTGSVAGQTARPDARPLYLAPDGDTAVTLDGPALAVCREEQAPQLFPLARISRVLSSTAVDWSGSALLACAGRGISVLFLDEQGRIAARLTGQPGARDELVGRFTEFLLLPQAVGMFDWWYHNYRRRAAHWAGARLGVPVGQRDPRHCQAAIERLAARLAGAAAALDTRQWLRGFAYAWMQAHLHDLGLGAPQALGQTGHPELAPALTNILIWYLEPARLEWLKSRQLAAKAGGEPLRPPSRREIIDLFESPALRVDRRGREITGALHRWLIHET